MGLQRAHIKPGCQFYVTVEDFQENPVHIPKRMNVAIAAEALTVMSDPNSFRKSPCIDQTTNPFDGGGFYAEKAPFISVERFQREVKEELLRSAQE